MNDSTSPEEGDLADADRVFGGFLADPEDLRPLVDALQPDPEEMRRLVEELQPDPVELSRMLAALRDDVDLGERLAQLPSGGDEDASNRTKVSAAAIDVAQWMNAELRARGVLYQSTVAYAIRTRFDGPH